MHVLDLFRCCWTYVFVKRNAGVDGSGDRVSIKHVVALQGIIDVVMLREQDGMIRMIPDDVNAQQQRGLSQVTDLEVLCKLNHKVVKGCLADEASVRSSMNTGIIVENDRSGTWDCSLCSVERMNEM